MSKPTKKSIKYNASVLATLNERYDVGLDFIRKSIRGDRNGTLSEVIKKEYLQLNNAAEKAVKDTLDKQL